MPTWLSARTKNIGETEETNDGRQGNEKLGEMGHMKGGIFNNERNQKGDCQLPHGQNRYTLDDRNLARPGMGMAEKRH